MSYRALLNSPIEAELVNPSRIVLELSGDTTYIAMDIVGKNVIVVDQDDTVVSNPNDGYSIGALSLPYTESPKILTITANSITKLNIPYNNKLLVVHELLIGNDADLTNGFNSCIALHTVNNIDVNLVSKLTGLFSGCGALINIPDFSVKNSIDVSGIFLSTKIQRMPIINIEFCTNLRNAFNGCELLTDISNLNGKTIVATDCANMLYNTAITSIDSVNFLNVDFNNVVDSCKKLISINNLTIESGTIISITYCTSLVEVDIYCPNLRSVTFEACTALTYVPQLDYSEVDNGYKMFSKCTSLADTSNLYIPKLVSATSMFELCNSLTSIVEQIDHSKLQTSNQMYYSCQGITEVSNLHMTSSNIQSMFHYCQNLASINNIQFDSIGNNIAATYLFAECINLKTVDNLKIGTNNTFYIYADAIFYSCTELISVSNSVIGNPNAIETRLTTAFHYCSKLTSFNADISSVTEALMMFSRCPSLTSIPDLNLLKCTSLESMFSYCQSLTTVGNIYAPLATKCNDIFNNGTSLTTIGELNVPLCTNFGYAFYNCYSLTEFPILFKSNCDYSYTFSNCTSITGDLIGRVFTSSITTGTFSYTGITGIYDCEFNASSSMFLGCLSLIEIDGLTIPVESETYAMQMFMGCTNLITINNFSFRNDNDISVYGDYMFYGTGIPNINMTLKGLQGNWLFDECLNLETVTYLEMKKSNALFHNCLNLNRVDHIKCAVNDRMFGTVQNLISIGIIDIENSTQYITSMSGNNTPNLEEIDTINNTGNGHMYFMNSYKLRRVGTINSASGYWKQAFYSTALSSIPVMNSKIKNAERMFEGTKITTYDHDLDLSEATVLESMFTNCSALTSVNIPDVFQYEIIATSMFSYSQLITSINISDASKFRADAITAYGYFSGSKSISNLIFNGFTSKIVISHMDIAGQNLINLMNSAGVADPFLATNLRTIILGATKLASLPEQLKTDLINKGWSLS